MRKKLRCVPLIPEFERFIRASATGRRRRRDDNRISGGTVETYKSCQRILEKFADIKGGLEIYTGLTVNKRIFRERSNYWQQVLFHFTDYLRSCRYSETYIWNNLKILRAFMHFLQQQCGWPDPGFAIFKMPRLIQPDPLVLSLEQVQQLVKMDFGDSRTDKQMDLIRNMMVTGVMAALRFSDLLALKWSNIIEQNGKSWLEIQSIKTGRLSKTLLPGFLMRKLSTYRKISRSNIFPRISNGWFNKLIKRLGRRMGWNEETRVFKCQNGLLKINRVAKFSELLTSHVMRRSGISLMLQLGMKENLIRRISGHAPNSKEFYRYIRIAQQVQDVESERVHRQICI
jgi:integrase